jgi:hypothetical protein
VISARFALCIKTALEAQLSHFVQRAAHATATAVEHVRINHRLLIV